VSPRGRQSDRARFPSQAARTPPGPGPWRAVRFEVGIAAAALVAVASAAYAVAGSQATVLVVVVFSALALVVVYSLLPAGSGPPPRPEVQMDRKVYSGLFTSYWRRRSDLTDAMASMSSYNTRLGPNLEHLLAARLSEHHGVSLYSQPEAARDVLCAGGRDADLWSWVGPGRAGPASVEGPGIPARTLARLVRRIEQL
jgi:hypothetical protein